MTRRALALAAFSFALAAPPAQAAYSGSVDGSTASATLTGAGEVALSTGGGVLRHGELGPGFASDADFDSAVAGDQTVPDTGGWTLTATGGGGDSMSIQEGEPVAPLSFAFGHTFFPGGVPCVVRDPNDRHGEIAFSRHPQQETRLCYQSGFGDVSVRAGAGTTDFGVLDTEPGVVLRLYGGPESDTMTEAANVPSGVGEPHNPQSNVYFSGGVGGDTATFNDGPARAPATYTVADGVILKAGLPPLHFDATVEALALYPQDGPSKITVGRTGGASLQVFGGFFGQKGPDRIDGRGADAPLLVTGSTGDDTILGSAFADYLSGGGGNDTIDSRDATFDQVRCLGGTGAVKVDTLDMVTDCPNAGTSGPLTGFIAAAFTPRKVKAGKQLTLDAVSTAPGKVTLTFKRRSSRAKTKKVSVKQGPNTLRFKPPRGLSKGRYSVSAVLRATNGRKSKPATLSLTIG